jgi:hypothetical protein
MTLLGVPGGGGFSMGVNTAPKIDCSLGECFWFFCFVYLLY